MVPSRYGVPERLVEGRIYVPAIDGLRAVAVLSVMLFHLFPKALPGGFVGVDLFFVISGYVVTGSLLRDAGLQYHHFIARFYARRFRRIVPALILCLAVTALVSQVLIPNAWLSNSIQSTGAWAFVGFSNFVLASNDGYFDPRAEFNPFTHTWSLAVEEQFYAIFPLLLYFLVSRRKGATFTRGLFALLCVGSFVWCAWWTVHSPKQAYYMLPSRFWELGIGAFVCLVGQSRRDRVIRIFGQSSLIWIGTALVLSSLIFADISTFPFPWAVPVAVGTGLSITAVTDHPGRQSLVRRALSWRPVVTIGLLSYSLYLWHWPVYTMFRWTVGLQSFVAGLIALVLTAVLSWASYRWIETPTQQVPLMRRLPAWGTILASVSAIGISALFADEIFTHPWRVSISVVSKNADEWYPVGLPASSAKTAPGKCTLVIRKHHGIVPGRDIIPSDCTPAPSNGTRKIFVAGDSHAWAYERLLALVSRSTGIPVTILSGGGCGIANLAFPSSEGGEACQDHVKKVRSELLTLSHPGDIVWLASLRIRRIANQWGDVDRGIEDQNVLTRQMAEAEAEGEDVIRALTNAGLKVIIDKPKPVFPSPPFRCADPYDRMNPVCSEGFSVPRDFIEMRRAAIVRTIDGLASQNPSISVWDPLPVLCPHSTCAAFEGRHPIFFDGDHLSGYGNEMLAPAFLTFLEDRFDVTITNTPLKSSQN